MKVIFLLQCVVFLRIVVVHHMIMFTKFIMIVGHGTLKIVDIVQDALKELLILMLER